MWRHSQQMLIRVIAQVGSAAFTIRVNGGKRSEDAPMRQSFCRRLTTACITKPDSVLSYGSARLSGSDLAKCKAECIMNR